MQETVLNFIWMYMYMYDCLQRKSKAKEIFDQYVSLRGSHSVNIDSNARKQAEIQLDNPTPQTFEVAQSQVGPSSIFCPRDRVEV